MAVNFPSVVREERDRRLEELSHLRSLLNVERFLTPQWRAILGPSREEKALQIRLTTAMKRLDEFNVQYGFYASLT